MEQSSRLAYLLQRYSQGNFTETERKELMEMVMDAKNAEELTALIGEAVHTGGAERDMSPLRADELFEKILQSAGEQSKIINLKSRNRFRWLIAASVLLVITAGSYFFLSDKKQPNVLVQAAENKPGKIIPPAANRATLTLGDGAVIVLDSAGNGHLAGFENIMKNEGRIIYNSNTKSTTVTYNTISTPKGGQYEIVLPDGTHVWLNAASTLKFPTAFAGSPRSVELSGEAYFEVSKNKQQPFTVSIQQSSITVLGTSFNVNGYADEKEINTTLIEGAVKFSSSNKETNLIPGQQVLYTPTNNTMRVQDADIAQVISWKNGFFEFDNLELPVIMRQIARWYDVEIIYKSIGDDIKLSGGISRKLSLQDLQRLMEANGIHFTIEGRKIIVGS